MNYSTRDGVYILSVSKYFGAICAATSNEIAKASRFVLFLLGSAVLAICPFHFAGRAPTLLGRHDVLGRCDERRGRAYGRVGSS